jgi:hypothetical protein
MTATSTQPRASITLPSPCGTKASGTVSTSTTAVVSQSCRTGLFNRRRPGCTPTVDTSFILPDQA